MSRVQLDLPDQLRARAEARARENGHASLEAYIESLIREDADDDSGNYGAPEHLSVRTPAELKQKLLERSSSPTSEFTADDWAELRRKLADGRGG